MTNEDIQNKIERWAPYIEELIKEKEEQYEKKREYDRKLKAWNEFRDEIKKKYRYDFSYGSLLAHCASSITCFIYEKDDARRSSDDLVLRKDPIPIAKKIFQEEELPNDMIDKHYMLSETLKEIKPVSLKRLISSKLAGKMILKTDMEVLQKYDLL